MKSSAGPGGHRSPALLGARDGRRRAYGWGGLFIIAILVAAFGCFALAGVWVARRPGSWEYWVNLLASGLLVLSSIGMFHNGRRMRKIAATGLLIFIGATAVWSLSFSALTVAGERILWAQWGQYYYYLPAPLTVISLAWLVYSSPRRLQA